MSAAPRLDPRITSFCRQVGASDLHAWLALPAGAAPAEVAAALERKRRSLESQLQDPSRAREAELMADNFELLRAALLPRAAITTTHLPDYYAALGANPAASFADLEAAWRRHQAAGREPDALVVQAWRVLGDPLNRARYDRSRREQAAELVHEAPYPVDPTGETIPPQLSDAGRRLILPGPDVRDVKLRGLDPRVIDLPLIVGGTAPWKASLVSDHPALTTEPGHALTLLPGRHALRLRVDPAALPEPVSTDATDETVVTLTITGEHERHVVALRLLRKPAPPPAPGTRLVWVALGVSLVLLGAALGTVGASVRTPRPLPASEGTLAQLPAVAACAASIDGPLPSWIDVHTDGLGRPTGFSIGGVAAPALEGCVKDALLRLAFPPTRDGLPVFHRYHVPADPRALQGP